MTPENDLTLRRIFSKRGKDINSGRIIFQDESNYNSRFGVTDFSNEIGIDNSIKNFFRKYVHLDLPVTAYDPKGIIFASQPEYQINFLYYEYIGKIFGLDGPFKKEVRQSFAEYYGMEFNGLDCDCCGNELTYINQSTKTGNAHYLCQECEVSFTKNEDMSLQDEYRGVLFG